MADLLGTDRDNEQLRNHLRQLQEQTTTIIRDASATIKSVSIVPEPGEFISPGFAECFRNVFALKLSQHIGYLV